MTVPPWLRNTAEQTAAPVLVVVLSLFACLPLLGPGLPQTADGMLHLYRAFGLHRALDAGILYPRVVPDFLFGYGYPLFNYYPPLSPYLVEALHRTGFGLVEALKLAYALSFPLAGLATYGLAQDVYGKGPSGSRWAAVLAAVAYVYLPYFLIVVYTRGALAEALSFALLPAGLWAFRRLVIDGGRWHAVGGAAIVALLTLTHAPLAMVFLPLLASYAILLAWRERQRRRAGLALLVALWGLGLSAFYWLPAAAERGWVAAANLTTGWYDFHHHFLDLFHLVQPSLLYPLTNPHPIPPRVGLVQLLLALGGLATVARRQRRGELLFFAAMALTGTYLAMPWSAWLWEGVPLLAGMSFPWRLLVFVGLGTSVLAGALVLVMPRRLLWAVGGVLAIVPIISTVPTLAPTYLDISPQMLTLEAYWRFEYQTMYIGTTSANEYTPCWLGETPWSVPRVPDAAYLASPQGSPMALKTTLLEHSPHGVRLWVEAQEPSLVRLHATFFPGWQALLDGKSIPVHPSTSLGLVTAEVPSGQHELHLFFGDTKARSMGKTLSLLSLLVLLLAAAPLLVWRHRATTLAWLGLILALIGIPLISKAPLTSTALTPLAEPAVFAGEIALLGYSVDTARLEQEGILGLRLFWQAVQPPSRNHIVQIRLRDNTGQQLRLWERHPQYGYSPTLRWAEGEIVADEYELLIPQPMAERPWEIQVGLRSGPETISLGKLETGTPPSLPAPLPPQAPPQRMLRADFGGEVELLGYDLPAKGTFKPGESISVTLHWRPLRLADRSYTIFMHLLDAEGRCWGQGDAEAKNGLWPTHLWREDEVVLDEHAIAMELAATPGSYSIELGVYFRPTLQRLPLLVEGGPIQQTSLMLPEQVIIAP